MSISAGNPFRFSLDVTLDVDFDTPTAAIFVGTSGDVSVVMWEKGNTQVFPNLPAGYILPGVFKRVNAAGTGAGGLKRLWN